MRVAEKPGPLVPGIVVAGMVAAVAMVVESAERKTLGQPIVEGLVAAILIGILVRNVAAMPPSVHRGSAFAAKQLLEVAVFLLGLTIDLRQVLAAGLVLLITIAVGVVGGISVSYTFGRLIGLPGKLAVLVAVGNSICGNSAIAAIAPVIRADKRDVASSIALTAIVGVVVILTLPLLIPLAHLSYYQYGVMAGMSVYAVPQVIAATYPVSQLSGQVATLVKLVRVLFLGPVAVSMGLLVRRIQGSAGSGRHPAYVPWFIGGFLVLAAIRFTGIVPSPAVDVVQTTSRVLMVVAMAGLGLGVDFVTLRQVGPRVLIAVVGSLAFLVSLSLAMILGLRVAG